MELALKRYPISVRMFHILAEQGAFAPDERVELIDGEIIEMSPIGSRHARCVDFLNRFLASVAGADFIVRIQNPIIAADDTEPQPDIAVVRYRPDFYRDSHPTGADTLLVIEIADTTVEFDRSKKLPKYAAAGIAEAWLVNLEAERVEVHAEPKSTTYGTVKIYQRGENAVSETINRLDLPVDEVVG